MSPDPGYGPVRRCRGKQSDPRDTPLSRPDEEKFEDFAEMMQDLVPRLLPATVESSPTAGKAPVSPRTSASKREASAEPPEAPDVARPRVEIEDELMCQLEDSMPGRSPIEVLLAGFLQKRAQKELPPSGNPEPLQQAVDEARSTEWETLSGKGAVRVWVGQHAKDLAKRFPNRFVGSRFVITQKSDEEGDRIKARWCLQGHKDPDVRDKVLSGACHQILVSKKWTMCLGDIKGAFLEAGPLDQKFRPLFAQQPPGGIPGIPHDALIEVLGNVYGQNDAPFNWYRTFDEAAQQVGFQKSQFDNCLYFFRDSTSTLSGVLGAHVDDTITGGEGAEFEAAIASLKQRFPYRKWRIGNGEFCGTMYTQDPLSKEITYQQADYAKHLRPISMSRDRLANKEAIASSREVAALRAVNGAANWLAGQSRPDLCVQTSFSQQCFPTPKVKDLLYANQLVHRARQHSNVEVVVKHVPWEDLHVCFHSDAGFNNASEQGTQAGYVLAFTSSQLEANEEAPWSPFCWRSFKLPRVVASTLAGETQCFSTACGVAEWMSCMISEAKLGSYDLRKGNPLSDQTRIIGITDCKSLYDALNSLSPSTKSDDKRVAIDLIIIKQAVGRAGLRIRWCPTTLMLADGFTKDRAEPAELLRAALRIGTYQLAPEASVLAAKREFREGLQRRKALMCPQKAPGEGA